LPGILCPNLNRVSPAVLWILLCLGAHAAQSPEAPPAPPDFDETPIVTTAEAISAAWAKWKRVDAGLEQRIFHISPAEARPAVQHALDQYLDIIDKRRTYSDAVSAYIDRSRAEPRPRQTVVSIGAVFQDHVQLLGFNLTLLEAKLGALRDAPQWMAIRRGVKEETAEAFNLQSTRRAEVPVDLSLRRAQPATLISTLIYRDSENQVVDVLRRLWTRYYQALVDATEPRRPAKPLRTGPPPA